MTHVTSLKSDRVYEQMTDWIQSRKFLPGNRLPSEQDLAKELGVNHQTLRRGLEKLVTDGLVIKRPSVGNFVAELPQGVEIAMVLPQWMRQAHRQHPMIGLLLSGAYQKIDSSCDSVSILFYRPGKLWEDAGAMLASRRVRGSLVKVDPTITPEDLQQFSQANIDVVLLGNCSPSVAEMGLPCFSYDPHLAIGPMMSRLFELGHRHITVFEYALELPMLRAARHEVVQRIAGNAGIKNWKDLLVSIPNADGHPELGIVKEVLSSANRPTAIVVPDEMVASEVFSFCFQHGVKVPEDLSIVAWCDNQPLGHAVALTAPNTVWLHTQEAEMATEHLLNSLAGKKQSNCDVILRGEITWTDSIGPPPVCGDKHITLP